MRSFIISSALLVILVQCGYPVVENSYPTTPSYPTPPPSYPVPKKYPVAPSYPSPSTYPAASSTSSSSDVSNFFNEEDNAVDTESSSNSEYRKRAKARTAHNRQFQRRALQPIRRFQQKKQ
ncbi:hypothetical protein CRE_18643 [Caenorhabditis remanei]|uniref:Uncharacterized protein n=2 Tax=Caenorhabditis remanei TaxID=31234 RepID=E3LKK4_CAERE|nr:hypothetical protein CRE_18643 [Caenorhabditis remanei]